MKIELNKLIYSNKNSRKYQYLTDAQEAIKIDFLLVLIDLPEIDKKVKLSGIGVKCVVNSSGRD
jgi:hypothetical protein